MRINKMITKDTVLTFSKILSPNLVPIMETTGKNVDMFILGFSKSKKSLIEKLNTS